MTFLVHLLTWTLSIAVMVTLAVAIALVFFEPDERPRKVVVKGYRGWSWSADDDLPGDQDWRVA